MKTVVYEAQGIRHVGWDRYRTFSGTRQIVSSVVQQHDSSAKSASPDGKAVSKFQVRFDLATASAGQTLSEQEAVAIGSSCTVALGCCHITYALCKMRLSVRRGRPWDHDLRAGTGGPIISGHHTGYTRHQPGYQLLPSGDLADAETAQPRHDGDTSLGIRMEELSFNTDNAEAGTRRISNASLISGASSQTRRIRSTPFMQAWRTCTTRLEALNTRIANRIQKSRYHGWRMGVLVGCCTSAFVLCCNVAIVIVGSQAQGGYKDDGIADLIIGSAMAISKWSTAALLVINIFSTMLLGARNYTMQVLGSPTRTDIDRAHARGRYATGKLGRAGYTFATFAGHVATTEARVVFRTSVSTSVAIMIEI
jgi:hypothetical protein